MEFDAVELNQGKERKRISCDVDTLLSSFYFLPSFLLHRRHRLMMRLTFLRIEMVGGANKVVLPFVI